MLRVHMIELKLVSRGHRNEKFTTNLKPRHVLDDERLSLFHAFSFRLCGGEEGKKNHQCNRCNEQIVSLAISQLNLK